MKVDVKREREKIDCYVGTVIEFNQVPCMVIDLGEDSDCYGILVLEGDNAGKVIEEFERLVDIDRDKRVTRELIKPYDVVITKGE